MLVNSQSIQIVPTLICPKWRHLLLSMCILIYYFMYIHHGYFSLISWALSIYGIMLIHEFSCNHFQGKWHPVHTLAASGEFYLMTSLLKHDVDINALDKVEWVTTTICIFVFHIHFACSYAYISLYILVINWWHFFELPYCIGSEYPFLLFRFSFLTGWIDWDSQSNTWEKTGYF